jgi:trans-feruloyl-CoA hydratase/vanillin synthase
MTGKSYEAIKVEKDKGITWLYMNRPDKRNAMSPQLHLEMDEVLDELAVDPETEVLVLTGAGDAFCAGQDIKLYFRGGDADPKVRRKAGRASNNWRWQKLSTFPKPTIAMINGFCFGGAFSIVEGCDLAIAADEATFGLSEVNFKLFPGGSVSKSLANLMRPRDALWYGMTGRPFGGKVAADIGFINLSVPLEKLREETMTVAKEIAAKDPWALKATKDGYRFSLEMSWDASMSYTSAKEFELVTRQNDAWRSEGIGDFLKGEYKPGLESHDRKRA